MPGPTTSPPGTVAPPPIADPPHHLDETGFDDHTVPSVASEAELLSLARPGLRGQATVKFAIPDLRGGGVHLFDSNFYAMHDEWYWFRLLNGRRVPGSSTEPIAGRAFRSVSEVYAWAGSLDADELPFDLAWIEGRESNRRLYSPEYYRLALHSEPRTYGVGSLIRFPGATTASGGPDRWLFELEYSDSPSTEDIVRFFERLTEVLPGEVASRLEWVIRSPEQEALAEGMERDGLAYGDRIVRYEELVPAGQTDVTSEGIAAGRLLYVGEGGAELSAARPTDIVIVDRVPDWLPPASALITAAPQTALSHVSLLARNRGIPSASRIGIDSDPAVRQAARVRAPAIVRASATGGLEIVLITESDYRGWQRRQSVTIARVPDVDVSAIPLIIDLSELSASIRTEADLDRWRPVIGGKSTGFLTLLSTPGVTPPPTPMAITVKAYVEHMGTLEPMVHEFLVDPDFVGHAQVRALVLEGREDFESLFSTESDRAIADDFTERHPPGSVIGDILAAGGFKRALRDQPIAAATLAEITTSLSARFGDYAVGEGLRFRSSSSVEDIEGFNGAGLYDSNTGYLHPESQVDPDDRGESIEKAIAKTWASYWSFEAFEERLLEHIDHLSGAMAITVHARSDDDLERDNGVATMTILPAQSDVGVEMTINVHPGSTSVANPDGQDPQTPEVIGVREHRDGSLEVTRSAGSTLSPGADVLTDADAQELFVQMRSIADRWRRRTAATLPAARRPSTLILDAEFKHVERGWPILAPGLTPYPSRLVIKQVRTLDPGLRRLPDAVRAIDAPGDVVARARRVERDDCVDAEGARTAVVRMFTDPLIAPDMGYSTDPLTITVPPQGSTGATTRAGCVTTVLFASDAEALVEILERSTPI